MGGRMLVWFGVLSAVGIVGLILLSALAHSGPVSTGSRSVTVRLDCYCGADESDTLLAYAAVGRGDAEAILSLTGKARAFTLTTGTLARAYVDGEKLTRVQILSGRHVGQRCWIPTSLLSR